MSLSYVTRSALSAAIAWPLAISGLAFAADAPQLDIAMIIQKETPLGKSVSRIVDALNANGFKSKGHYSIAQWPGQKQSGEIGVMNAIKAGEVQMMMLSDGPCANIAPACSIFTMPFVLNGYEHAWKVADSKAVLDQIGGEFQKQGLRLIAIYENGWRHFFSPKETIKDPAQIKEKKFRVMQSSAYMKFVSSMDGIPTPTAWPDVYAQTKAGVVYGFEVPIPPFYTAKLYEVNKYLTLSEHMYSVFYALVSEQAWQKLTPAQRDTLTKIVWEERVRQRKENAVDSEEKLEALKKQGMTVYKLSAAERNNFKKATAPVWEEFKSKFSPEVIKAIEEAK